MEKNLYIMVGISGAGKSTWIKNTTKDLDRNEYRIISPDNERKKLTGDISNQECSSVAFFNCHKQLERYVDDESVLRIYWDATNLSTKSLKDIIITVEKAKLTWAVHLVCFEDSRDWELCQSRVENDIKNGVDRSNSLVNITRKKDDVEETVPLIKSMSDRYINMVDNVLDDWCARYGVDKFYVGGNNDNRIKN